jgi:hypothetical protein
LISVSTVGPAWTIASTGRLHGTAPACIFERRITPDREQLRGVIAAFGVARAVLTLEIVVRNASAA